MVNRPDPLPTNFPGTTTAGFLGVLSAGVYPMSIRVTDSVGATFDKAITITVTDFQIPRSSSPPRPTVGIPYQFDLETIGVVGTAPGRCRSTTAPSPGRPERERVGSYRRDTDDGTPAGTNPTIILTDSGRPASFNQRFIGFTFRREPVRDHHERSTRRRHERRLLHPDDSGARLRRAVHVHCNERAAGWALVELGRSAVGYTDRFHQRAGHQRQVVGTNGTSLKTFSIRINIPGIQPLRIDTGPALHDTSAAERQSPSSLPAARSPTPGEIEDGTLPPGIVDRRTGGDD